MRVELSSCLRGIVATVCLFLPSPLFAGAFTSSSNLVVVRLGDGSGFTPGTTRPLHLDEYSVGGAGASFVQSVAIPSSGGSAVTLTDALAHDGLLNRSVDGHYLVLAGYRADVGADDPASFLSDPAIPRVIVRVAANGTVDTSTVLTDGSYTQNTIRAVATDDGSRFWVAGDNANNEPANEANIKGGLRYVASLGAVDEREPEPTAVVRRLADARQRSQRRHFRRPIV